MSITNQINLRKAGANTLRSVAKHSAELATCAAESGAIDVLVMLLEDFDAGVREAAVAAIASICSHGAGEYAVLRSHDQEGKRVYRRA